MSTRFITRPTRIVGSTLCAVGFLALSLAGSASADEGHVHADPAAAVPPAAVPAVAVETPAAAPAPGAQPAPAPAPARTPAPVAAPAPVDHSAHASKAPARVAAPETVSPASGGGAQGAPIATAAPLGELPFTGPGDNILLIALAGMFMPIGVLLFCAARRGDLRLHLGMPRFQWAPAPHMVRAAHAPPAGPAVDPRAFQWADH